MAHEDAPGTRSQGTRPQGAAVGQSMVVARDGDSILKGRFFSEDFQAVLNLVLLASLTTPYHAFIFRFLLLFW